jgi:hypothetical protein
MKKYARKFNEFTGDYEGPDHKTESHWNDAMRYAFASIDQKFDKETGTCYLMGGEEVDYRYQPEDTITTRLYTGHSAGGDWDPDPIHDDWDI